MDGAASDLSEREASVGTALAATDGRYLDADPAALDLYGVTLDVLRQKRIGDFSRREYAEFERQLWSLWVRSNLPQAGGDFTVVRANGTEARISVALERTPEGNVRLTLKPVDQPVRAAPLFQVQNILGLWRDLERHLAEMPPDDPARRDLEARIDALREEYQRRVGGR